jgi:hypothetical protein
VRYVRAWKGPISERTGVPKPHIAKRGRLGDATLPALRARDKRQAIELRIVARHAAGLWVLSALAWGRDERQAQCK